MNKNIIKSITTISIIAALFVSCSGVNSKPAEGTSKDALTITGSFSTPEANASRSATTSSSLDGDFELLAYQSNETPLSGTVDAAASTWSVKLNKTGEWNIVIKYTKENVLVLTGSTKITLESLTAETKPADCVIKLAAADSENKVGFINLEIQNQTTSIATLSYVLSGSNLSALLSKEVTFTDNIATIKIDSLAEGIYELELYFSNSTGDLLYHCKEQIPVYSNFTTNTWYGESPYFVTTEGKTSFVITDKLLASFTSAKPLAEDKVPVILYDFNYNTNREDSYFYEEFENHVPGMSIFESITANQKLADGIPLAINRNVKDFAIDDVTQAIYTLEEFSTSKGKVYQIVSYPYYAGYGYGKTIYSQLDTEINAIYAHDGCIYALSPWAVHGSLIKLQANQEPKYYILQDETEQNLEIFPLEDIKSITVYKDYVYIVEPVTDDLNDDKKFVFNFEKFAFIDNEEGEDSYIRRVSTGHEFIFSNTDLPSAIDFSYGYLECNPKVTDIQIIPDTTDDQKLNIYTLFNLEKCNNSECITYGGLLNVSTENNQTSDFIMQTFDQEQTVKVFGWFSGTEHTDTEINTNTWFYGPRKFIAKKPDELVIVDEGTYYDASHTKQNKNRVVTVSLKDFAMSVVNVNVSFANYSKAGSPFIGKYGEEY